MKALQGSTLLLLLVAGSMDAYKPILIVHGIFYGSITYINLSEFISKVHPGTQVVAVDNFNKEASLTPLWKQVKGFAKIINNLMQMYPDGVHLICFSQGTVICRGVLSTLPDHNVHTFIALSGPLVGQYGEPNLLRRVFPGFPTKTVHLICYNGLGQKVSICNYWNDPFHRGSYLRSNNFLPLLNGEKPHSKMKVWKENFLRIKKLVLIGGPDDGVITPWQSSLFGFFDSNSNHILEMKNQKFYLDDSFGLKTLDERGDISVCIRSGVKHSDWPSNFTVFKSCMEEWLT